MQRTAIRAGLCFLCLIIFKTSTASALTPPDVIFSDTLLENNDLSALVLGEEIKTKKETRQPVIYEVKPGDSLVTIAKIYKTSWQRIFDNNTSISSPDLINPGDKLEIPDKDKKLKKRLAEPVRVGQSSEVISTKKNESTPIKYSASASGNGYVRGYCTWYAKSRRGDLPNNLGNADTWTARASAQGFSTGSRPRTGAIGQQGMHVVYVERVNRGGTVTVSEMNYAGFGVISSRTVPASYFSYIY